MEQNTELIMRAKNDEKAISELINKDKAFIKGTAYKTVNHFITENDDEWSISLIAFNEAVKSYDESKGAFYPFAQMVIKRRLLDYIYSQEKFKNELSQEPSVISGDLDDQDEPTALQMEVQSKNAELSLRTGNSVNNPIKDEIESLQAILKEYGFTFYDLAKCSPKADKTKKACAEITAVIIENQEIRTKMRNSKTIPIADITKKVNIHRKIFEHHRKYIIAAVEILSGDYPLLSEYMDYVRKVMKTR
ncbi:MAG: RNA polymerase subunit sigma [Butyrivibrio sp.]|nr:RNA polymerase subunit sigma [Butyrivibrio sp.]